MAKKRNGVLVPKTQEQIKAALANRKETRRNAEAAPTFYANNANVTIGPWDVRIRLSQVEEATLERLTLNELCTIYMSPQHAKAFSDLLAKKVAQHERIMQKHSEQLSQLVEADDADEDAEG